MKSFGSLSVNAIKLISCKYLCIACRIVLRPATSCANEVAQVVAEFAPWEYLLHSSLGHRYSTTVQVLLQPLVELIETTQLQLRHRLLLAPVLIIRPDFIRGGRHLACVNTTCDRIWGICCFFGYALDLAHVSMDCDRDRE